MESFLPFGFPKSIIKVLLGLGYTKPFPIQREAIPAILDRRDVLGIAPTGSGKTASFVLPILTNLQGDISKRNRHANVLVLVPTRELAAQVAEVFRVFSIGLKQPIKTIAVHGGVSQNPQMKALQGTNVLIATPGRLLDLVGKNAVTLSHIELLVLDEADKMLNLGFKDEMTQIFGLLPTMRQNILFSATLNEDVDDINQILLKAPVVVRVEPEKDHIDLIRQLAYAVPEDKKGVLLRYLIKNNDWKQVLVFTSSGKKADNVTKKLIKNGIDAAPIHSKKSQGARTAALKKFKEGELQVLVSTDLLSRGIDIEFLPCVINYQLPRSPKDYVHRIGRTGRAEASGDAITFVSPEEDHHFGVIQKKMKRWVEMKGIEDIDLTGY